MTTVRNIAFAMLLTGALAGCISGVKKPDSVTAPDGKTTVIESNAEMCRRSCNDSYSRCMDTTSASGSNTAAVDSMGVHGPSGVFGASGDCRSDLQKCLPGCKAQ